MDNNNLFINGFVIKAHEDSLNLDPSYKGIASGLSYPLDLMNDELSVALTREAEARWFFYQDVKMWAVPDYDYILRYRKHCIDLGFSVYCLQIESKNQSPVSNIRFSDVEFLGYEYVDTDMSTSVFYEDITATDDEIQRAFSSIKNDLNSNMLLNSYDKAAEYVAIRNNLINSGIDMEEYYSPSIIKLSCIRD